MTLLAGFALQFGVDAQIESEPFGKAALQTLTNLTKSVFAATGRRARAEIDLQVNEVLLGRIPDSLRLDTLSTKQDTKTYWRAVDKAGRAWSEQVAVSPDQKHLVIVEKDDGKEGPGFMLGRVDGSLLESLFSPDSQRLAYRITLANKACYVVVDGSKGALHEEVRNLCFSPDSKHVAYWRTHYGKWRVAVDGQVTGSYDEPLFGSSVVFDTPNSLTALTRQSNAVLRLEINLKVPRENRRPVKSQRDSITQPRVGAQHLPWVIVPPNNSLPTPTGLYHPCSLPLPRRCASWRRGPSLSRSAAVFGGPAAATPGRSGASESSIRIIAAKLLRLIPPCGTQPNRVDSRIDVTKGGVPSGRNRSSSLMASNVR